MSEFRVTSSQLNRGSQELLDLNGQFQAAISALENYESSLNGMWDGEANDAFHAAFMTDKGKMTEFYKLIIQYATSFNAIATRYDQTEQMNTDIANRRTY